MDEGQELQRIDLDTARLEAFSDAVMAVIMTILAFDLRTPDGSDFEDIAGFLPGFLIYVLSFAFLAIYWNNHHHLLRVTDRINGAIMWANMFLLFTLSLIPVVSEWLRDYPLGGVPVAAFGVVSFLAAIAFTVLVRAIVRENGEDSAVGRAVASDLKGKMSLALYAVAVGLAFVQPWISYALYVAVSIVWLIPDRRFTRAPAS